MLIRKKYFWLPLCLLIYAVAISLYFGPTLIAVGHSYRLWISVAVEVVVILGVFFTLRHKDKMQQKYKRFYSEEDK